MSDSPYPTLAHALAALDALPIAGAMQITPDNPGIDFDALARVRRILPNVWSDQVSLEAIDVTSQGGVAFRWRRADALLEVIIDPYALISFHLDTKSKVAEWTRATPEQAVADIRRAFGLSPLTPPAAAGTPASSSAGVPAPAPA